MRNSNNKLMNFTFNRFLLAFNIFVMVAFTEVFCEENFLTTDQISFVSESKENQRFPTICFSGGVFLVAWQEGWNGVGGDAQIRGAIVKCSMVDAKFSYKIEKLINICSASDHQEIPQVFYSGGLFLVVWHDFRNGKDSDIYGARVTLKGDVLDQNGIPIAVRAHNQNFPVICGNGQDFLVVWREIRFGQSYDLVASRIESKTGKVLDEKGIRIADNVAFPAVGFTGKYYVIAWLDPYITRKLQFCRYDSISLKREETEPNSVGHSDAFSRMGQLKLVSGKNEVLALWARGIRPDPWGWGGPGAFLSLRIKEDGQTPENEAFNKIRWSPEGRTQYVDRLLPGVLDSAHWKDLPGWPQGKPGGFKEAEGGIWPYSYVSGTQISSNKDAYFAVWLRAHLDGLNQTGKFDIVGSRVQTKSIIETLDFPPLQLVRGEICSLPVLSAGSENDPVLFIYENRNAEGQSIIKGGFVNLNQIK
jgi:hypothetical protein